MTLRNTSLFAAALAALSLTACSDDADDAPVSVAEARSVLQRDTTPDVDAATVTQLVHDDSDFGLALYGQLAAGKAKGKNVFFSAHSVSRAFAMLYGGARGETERQIAAGLRFTLPPEKLHAAMNKVALELDSRAEAGGTGSDGKGFRLAMNNSFWGEKTFAWETPYLDLLAVNYGAGINLVDFAGSSEASRKTINGWTAQKTEQRIKELLPQGSLDPSTRFVLVNTVYFNAAWLEEFTPTTVPFAGGAAVPAIQQVSNDFRYAETEDAVAVSVPYEGRKLELVVVVPNALDAFESKLDGDLFRAIGDKLAPANVDLTMPKVKIEGETVSLQTELSAMGLESIFGGGDFSGMARGGGLTIDDVYHQAFVKIDEKGTEAAAATAIVGRETSATIDPPKKVVVDKPYLFFIRDVPTGLVLFTGRVVAPSFAE